ncbi:MAG: hypothetical protein KBC76_10535 [Deltaproteobacteria bacterium]|jgi:hypothetical protein|nr:hypothetical protein [Deltaproteobacteria bacterium]HPO33934.1 hypothetical protein [Deltaproteobacteria bacterium]
MWNKVFTFVCLALVFSPQCLVGSDMFGTFTYRGKVVDADTLQPIQGAVVVAEWYKCWPGIGAGELCDFSMAKEALTDANGEWSITGPEGTWVPSTFRAILGFIVRWTRPPIFMIYKPGYFLYGKYGQGSRNGFRAIPYEDKERGVAGIALERSATMLEELYGLDIDFNNEVPFISADDPVKRLRSMDFTFKYSKNVQKIPLRKLNYPWCQYWVLGLKKTATEKEWRKEQLTSGNVSEWEHLPLLRKVIGEEIKNPIQFD